MDGSNKDGELRRAAHDSLLPLHVAAGIRWRRVRCQVSVGRRDRSGVRPWYLAPGVSSTLFVPTHPGAGLPGVLESAGDSALSDRGPSRHVLMMPPSPVAESLLQRPPAPRLHWRRPLTGLGQPRFAVQLMSSSATGSQPQTPRRARQSSLSLESAVIQKGFNSLLPRTGLEWKRSGFFASIANQTAADGNHAGPDRTSASKREMLPGPADANVRGDRGSATANGWVFGHAFHALTCLAAGIGNIHNGHRVGDLILTGRVLKPIAQTHMVRLLGSRPLDSIASSLASFVHPSASIIVSICDAGSSRIVPLRSERVLCCRSCWRLRSLARSIISSLPWNEPRSGPRPQHRVLLAMHLEVALK